MRACTATPKAESKRPAPGFSQRLLKIIGVAGPVAMCCYYGLCTLLALLLRYRFVPYNQYVYAAVLVICTVGACTAGILSPPDDSDGHTAHYTPARYIPAGLMPMLAAFCFSDLMNVMAPWLALPVIILCLTAALKLHFVCVTQSFFRGISILGFLAVMVFCLLIWLHPLLFPTSETVLHTQRLYNESGQVAVATQTRAFGHKVRTEVSVYECTPFSLLLGRFEKSYTTRAFVQIADLSSPVPAELRWDGRTLYVNGEETPYSTS